LAIGVLLGVVSTTCGRMPPAARLALGATDVWDMIVNAWRASADVGVGYPMVSVRDIESGKIAPTRALFGAD
jgi:hypothetical protein